jgi:hypothetical protein
MRSKNVQCIDDGPVSTRFYANTIANVNPLSGLETTM